VKKNDLVAYYSARAAEYDRIYAKPERQNDLRAMERWLPAQLSKRTVLELACGTGYWTQFIAQAARTVVAIDAAPEPLAIARRRIRQSGVTFLLGDAYRLPSDIGVFDAAIAGFWFSHVPRSRRQEFLLHLNERLTSRSPVILFDNLYVKGSSTPIAEQDNEGNTYQLRRLKDGTTHRVLKNFPTEAELVSLVEKIGENGRFTRWNHYWALTYVTPSV
jgi:2-polyprenyl-3-methyl-5-hydroxy-6-metoxy-1,4-benzoquinol methylase